MSNLQTTKYIEHLKEEVEELGGDISIKGSEIDIIKQLKELLCELQSK